MAGYDWQSGMSNNAVRAYENGEMPLSKWTKKAILEAVRRKLEDKDELRQLTKEYGDVTDELLECMKKATLCELRYYALEKSGYHHTSKYYNITYFYEMKSLYDLFHYFSEKAEREREEEDARRKKEYEEWVFIEACETCRRKTLDRFFSFGSEAEQQARKDLYRNRLIVCFISAQDSRTAIQCVVDFCKKNNIRIRRDAMKCRFKEIADSIEIENGHDYELDYLVEGTGFCKYWVTIKDLRPLNPGEKMERRETAVLYIN